MHIKRDPTLNKYRLKGEEIVNTSHHSYLGVQIQDDGKWSKLVETVPKGKIEPLDLYADNLVGARNHTLYTAMVRHHMEYAYRAWNPPLKNDINKLENIQRKASRFVKKKKKMQ